MNSDKQIEGMAKYLHGNFIAYDTRWLEDCRSLAISLYDAGYRKSTDLAREIFEEIEEIFRQHTDGGYYLNNAWIPEYLNPYTQDAVAELKKKYTEGEG